MALAHYADGLSDIDVLAAYLDLFDPVAWLRKAKTEPDAQACDQLRRIARFAVQRGQHETLNRVLHRLMQDAIDLRAGLAAVAEYLPQRERANDPELQLLHALRIALIQTVYVKTAQIPRFSSQPDITIDDVVDQLLQLNIPPALAVLRQAFPIAPSRESDATYGEAATYRADEEEGYVKENEHLFDPLEQLYGLIRKISFAISHRMGAVG